MCVLSVCVCLVCVVVCAPGPSTRHWPQPCWSVSLSQEGGATRVWREKAETDANVKPCHDVCVCSVV